MSQTAFRVSGGGNDFLALVEPGDVPAPEAIRAWCRRGLSLGADGVFVLTREGDGVRMAHFNADGGRAELCVNGARCAARLALDLGWAEDGVELLTDAGSVRAQPRAGRRIELALPPPSADPRAMTLDVDGEAFDGWYSVVGVPHFVVEWPRSLARVPVNDLGRRLRHHPELKPAGANVDFVRFLPPARLELRTFERGVEAETLACGTGVLASVATALAAARLELPLTALTRGGCELEVSGQADVAGIRAWSLTGDARILGRVEILGDATVLPDPPDWSPD